MAMKKVKADIDILKDIVANPFTKDGNNRKGLQYLQVYVDLTSRYLEVSGDKKAAKLYTDFMAYATKDEAVLRKFVDADFDDGNIEFGRFHEVLTHAAFVDHNEAAMRTVAKIMADVTKPVSPSGRKIYNAAVKIAKYRKNVSRLDAYLARIDEIRKAILDFGANAAVKKVSYTDEELENLLTDMVSFVGETLRLAGVEELAKDAEFSLNAILGRPIDDGDDNNGSNGGNSGGSDDDDGYIKITADELEELQKSYRAEGYEAARAEQQSAKSDTVEKVKTGYKAGYNAAIKDLLGLFNSFESIKKSERAGSILYTFIDNNLEDAEPFEGEEIEITPKNINNFSGLYPNKVGWIRIVKGARLLGGETIVKAQFEYIEHEETIAGGNDDDTINSGDSNDTIEANDEATISGSDDATLFGGNDEETISGADDNETIASGSATIDSGNVTLTGGDSNDTLETNDDDTIEGSADNETIEGCVDNDTILSWAAPTTTVDNAAFFFDDEKDEATITGGNVTITGSSDDTIEGSAAETIDSSSATIAGSGDTTLFGNNDEATIEGSTDKPLILTTEGAVKIKPTQAAAFNDFLMNAFKAKILDKVVGVDVTTIDFQKCFGGKRVSKPVMNGLKGNLTTVTNSLPELDTRVYFLVKEGEEVGLYYKTRGGNGDGGNPTITGGTGNDTITSGDSNDTITGGNGNDTIGGSVTNPVVIYQEEKEEAPVDLTGKNTLVGGTGNDTITSGDGEDDAITVKKVVKEAFDVNIGLVDCYVEGLGNVMKRVNVTDRIRLGAVSNGDEKIIFVNPEETHAIYAVEYTSLGETKWLYYAVRNGVRNGQRRIAARMWFSEDYEPEDVAQLGIKLVDKIFTVPATLYVQTDGETKIGDERMKQVFANPDPREMVEGGTFDIHYFRALKEKMATRKAEKVEVKADPNEDPAIIKNYIGDNDSDTIPLFVGLFDKVLDKSFLNKPEENAPDAVIRAYNEELDSNLWGLATLTAMFWAEDVKTVEDAQKWLRDHVGFDRIVKPTAGKEGDPHLFEFLVASADGTAYKQYYLDYGEDEENNLVAIEM